MSQIGRGRKKSRFNLIILFVSMAMIFLSAGIFIFELIRFSQSEDKIPLNVVVGGLDVGGLNRADATAKWENLYGTPLTLYYNRNPIILNPDTLGFRISSETMLAKAFATAEQGTGFWDRFISYLFGQTESASQNIALEATYQEGVLRSFLEDIALRYDSPSEIPRYDLQSLIIYPGGGGEKLDIDAAITAIDAALRDPSERTVTLPLGKKAGDETSMDDLQQLIISYLDSKGFIYDGNTTVASIYIQDLTSGEEINILGDVSFSAASTIKVPIMLAFFGKLNSAPTADEAWLMANSLLCSNNSSSNLIMQIVGDNDLFKGLQIITDNTLYLGANNTYITAPFIEGFEGQQLGSIPAPATSPNPNFDTVPDPYNQTTAEDMGTLFSLIYDCANFGSGLITAYPDERYTPQECKQMLELMSANDLQRLLQAGLPPGTRISHKNGWIFDTVGDSGIVYPPNGHNYVISVYLWEEAEFQDYEKLWPLIEEISRATWNFFSPETALLSARTDIPATAQECYKQDANGNITEYVYLPPGPEAVNLNDINGWRRNQ
ncbi:hypothetical protein MASR2M15_24640 [Anaerolineales bacterium]